MLLVLAAYLYLYVNKSKLVSIQEQAWAVDNDHRSLGSLKFNFYQMLCFDVQVCEIRIIKLNNNNRMHASEVVPFSPGLPGAPI